ncbi:MAG: hypothetical protein FGM46_10170 [Ferruginibacter sp.]|nr:hypothetical protein [Ferruginibacter sp.]
MNLQIFRDLLDFSILVPLVTGIFRYNKLNLALKWFCCYLFLGAVNEFCSFLIPKTPFISNIQNYFFIIFENFFLLATLQNWMDRDKKSKFFILFLVTSCIIFSISIEIYLKGVSEYRYAFNFIISDLIVIKIVIYVFVQTITIKNIRQKDKQTRLLILIPLLIVLLNYVISGLAIYFLYEPNNIAFYQNLYWLVSITNVFSYTFYTLAFIWAPLKEKFL